MAEINSAVELVREKQRALGNETPRQRLVREVTLCRYERDQLLGAIEAHRDELLTLSNQHRGEEMGWAWGEAADKASDLLRRSKDKVTDSPSPVDAPSVPDQFPSKEGGDATDSTGTISGRLPATRGGSDQVDGVAPGSNSTDLTAPYRTPDEPSKVAFDEEDASEAPKTCANEDSRLQELRGLLEQISRARPTPGVSVKDTLAGCRHLADKALNQLQANEETGQ